MKRFNGTQTLIRSLALIGGSFLAYTGNAYAAAPDDGAQAQARTLLSPPIRAGAADRGSNERADKPVSAADAVQQAQRFLLGTADVHADRPESSAALAGASLRLRLTERRHEEDLHELIRRTILGQRA
jgi:hypothetical protein